MGSATTQATAASFEAMRAASGVDLDAARGLFAAARAVYDSTQLSDALTDSAVPSKDRTALATRVFAPLGKAAVSVLGVAVAQRWSSPDDLIGGIEKLAVHAAAAASPKADIEGELFAFARTVADNPDLELALGSRLGSSEAKGALAEKLLDGRASDATTVIVSSLVRQPRGRRVRQLLNEAMTVVADQRGRMVAQVSTAAPLSAQEVKRLTDALSRRYGKAVSLNQVVDPAIVGGLRVQAGDDVIDASISTRLQDLRQRLAG